MSAKFLDVYLISETQRPFLTQVLPTSKELQFDDCLPTSYEIIMA